MILLSWAAALGGLSAPRALADAYDPPANYYSTATGTGATLKSQLHKLIDAVDDPGIADTVATTRSYDDLRTDLQYTDVDPNNSSRIVLVYNNRVSIAKPTGGSIPGWDNGVSWNREHSWPQARGVDSTGAPDGSDMHHVFPSDNAENNLRGNLNFGGAFGAQGHGTVLGGTQYYPGDLDAGLIARAQFYMAVRYDGVQSGTKDLELATGNPASGGTTLGDLNRLIEWHFAAPPDTFERRRNQIIFEGYDPPSLPHQALQNNRNPFIDHPEFVWSIFKGTNNNSQITVAGGTANVTDGSSNRNIDLGRVYVGGAVPGAQSVTLNKAGNDGTYFQVTTSGLATSTLSGPRNAFRTNQTDSKTFSVGLNTTTSTAGLKSGTVTVDNLDITGSAGSGIGVGDANDTINLSLAVLSHPVASFSANVETRERVVDFGIFPIGSGLQQLGDSFNNFAGFGAPVMAANLDLDSISGTGDTGVLQLDLSPFANLAQGQFKAFNETFLPTTVGEFTADYTLHLSDENLPGEQLQTLTLKLTAEAILAGDYNRDGRVDTADYVVWRSTYGASGAAYNGADGDGSGSIGDGDFAVWRSNFGLTAASAGGSLTNRAAVPEPSLVAILIGCSLAVTGLRRDRTIGAV